MKFDNNVLLFITDKDSIDDEDVLPPLFLSLDAVDDVTEDSGTYFALLI